MHYDVGRQKQGNAALSPLSLSSRRSTNRTTSEPILKLSRPAVAHLPESVPPHTSTRACSGFIMTKVIETTKVSIFTVFHCFSLFWKNREAHCFHKII